MASLGKLTKEQRDKLPDYCFSDPTTRQHLIKIARPDILGALAELVSNGVKLNAACPVVSLSAQYVAKKRNEARKIIDDLLESDIDIDDWLADEHSDNVERAAVRLYLTIEKADLDNISDLTTSVKRAATNDGKLALAFLKAQYPEYNADKGVTTIHTEVNTTQIDTDEIALKLRQILG